MGARKLEDVGNRLQKGIQLLFQKNIGTDFDTQDETVSAFMSNSDNRRQIIEIEELKPDVQQAYNALMNKQNCIDIF